MTTEQPWRASLQAPAQGSVSRWPWAHHGEWHLVGCLEQEGPGKVLLWMPFPQKHIGSTGWGKRLVTANWSWAALWNLGYLQSPGESSWCLSEPEWILRKSVPISCSMVSPLRFHSKLTHRMTIRQDCRGFWVYCRFACSTRHNFQWFWILMSVMETLLVSPVAAACLCGQSS